MKGLLNRLMARQARLMDELLPNPDAKRSSLEHRHTLTLSAEQRAVQLAAEDQALTEATDPLARGAIAEAAALLEPLADTAQDTRTYTTLSRIRSMQGDFDRALRLLQRAESLNPADEKVTYFMAELLQGAGRHHDAIAYRRRMAFARADAGARTYVQLIGAIVNASAAGRPPPAGEIRAALKRLHAAPDLTAELQFEAAQLLYRVPSLSNQALEWLAEASPCPPDQTEIHPRWQTMPSWSAAASVPMHVLANAGTPGRRPWVIELRDVLLHPRLRGTAILDDGRTIIHGFDDATVRTHVDDASSPLLLDKGTRAVLRLPRDFQTIQEPALYLGGSGNYAVDMLEHFGSLATVEALGLCADLPLVVNHQLAPHQLELLSLLGLEKRKLIHLPPEAPVQFARLWLPSKLSMGGSWIDPRLAQWYRQRLGHSDRTSLHTPSRKILVSDAQARGRIFNEDELMRVLSQLGFERVEISALSMRQRIDLFEEAREVVGIYGSAMTHLVFAKPYTRVVLLRDKRLIETGGRLYYDALARACGHQVETVTGQAIRVDVGARAQGLELLFNPRDVASALTRFSEAQ